MTDLASAPLVLGRKVVSVREIEAFADCGTGSSPLSNWDAAASLDPLYWSISASAEADIMSFHLSNSKNAIFSSGSASQR